MCGRTTHLYSWEEVAEYFGMTWAEPLVELQPRYNVGPGQAAPVVRMDVEAGQPRLDALRWGLIPGWAKDHKIGYRTINARAETVASKPAFRSAFKRRRCLVPVSGFYEWQKLPAAGANAGGRKGKPVKQPWLLRPAEGSILALAGLWERWQPKDAGAEGGSDVLESFTIITTEANATMAPLHDRMPVILPPTEHALWLDPELDDAEVLQGVLRPAPEGLLAPVPVSTHVNRVQNDDPRCLEPVAPPLIG